MADFFAFTAAFIEVIFPIGLILYFIGIPFLVSGLIRIMLYIVKSDEKKANKIFGVLWITLMLLLFIFMMAFYPR